MANDDDHGTEQSEQGDTDGARTRAAAAAQAVGAPSTGFGTNYDHPDASGDFGALQRLRMHVPTKNTTLVLGHKDISEGVGYPGITGITDGEIFFTSEQATLTLQSKEYMLLQSLTNELFIMGKKKTLFGSMEQAYVSGHGGAVLCGGYGPDPAGHATIGDIPGQRVLHDLEALSERVEKGLHFRESATKLVDSVITALSPTATLMGAVTELSALAGIYSALHGGKPGPAGAMVHGKDSAALTSDGPAVVSGTSVSIIGDSNADLAAPKTAAIIGGKKAAVVSAVKGEMLGGYKVEMVAGAVAEVASRFGKAEVVAPTVEIGTLMPKFPQKITKKVEIGATTEVSVVSQKEVEVIANQEVVVEVGEISPTGVPEMPFQIAAPVAGLEMKATEKVVEIYVGEFKVVIGEHEIKIGKAESKQGHPENPVVEIKGDQILLKKGDAELRVADEMVTMQSNNSTGIGLVGNNTLRFKGDKCFIL